MWSFFWKLFSLPAQNSYYSFHSKKHKNHHLFQRFASWSSHIGPCPNEIARGKSRSRESARAWLYPKNPQKIFFMNATKIFFLLAAKKLNSIWLIFLNFNIHNLCHASVSLQIELLRASSASDCREAAIVAVGDLHVVPLLPRRPPIAFLEGDARVLRNLLHCRPHQIALVVVYEKKFRISRAQKKIKFCTDWKRKLINDFSVRPAKVAADNAASFGSWFFREQDVTLEVRTDFVGSRLCFFQQSVQLESYNTRLVNFSSIILSQF